MIIVIDGPAGSGKSSTAKAVAKKLGIEYLDSGALYRALTIIFLESGKNPGLFFDALDSCSITFHYEDEVFYVTIDGRDVTERLRSSEVANYVSKVASFADARVYVNNLMRKAVENGRYIAEGRDLGTAVFRDAELKFFMTADVEERAQRRFSELKKRGVDTTLAEVKQNILHRDKTDSERESDPLLKADDAIEINTTHLTFEQQVEKICSAITERIELFNT